LSIGTAQQEKWGNTGGYSGLQLPILSQEERLQGWGPRFY